MKLQRTSRDIKKSLVIQICCFMASMPYFVLNLLQLFIKLIDVNKWINGKWNVQKVAVYCTVEDVTVGSFSS